MPYFTVHHTYMPTGEQMSDTKQADNERDAATEVAYRLTRHHRIDRVEAVASSDSADQLRAQAAQHDRDAAESFERCDTDGFLSQWASGMTAQLKRTQATLAEHGDTWTFARTVLTRTDGSIVEDAREVTTRYGQRWRSDSENVWLPVRPKRATTLGKRGFAEVEIEEVAPAAAIHWAPAGARGLGGASQVRTIIIRTDRPKAEGWRPVGSPQA
jgi:hypothetical protein